jgi:hypothetical protein
MAKLLLSGIVSGLSGKHSGAVHMKGRGDNVMRRKVSPKQPASNYNSIVRARMAAAQSAWAGLDSDQVLGWNELAKQVKRSNVFGSSYALSGINLFQMLNSNLLNAGESIIEDAPALGTVGLWTTLTPSVVHDGAVSIAFGPTPVPVGSIVVLKATRPMHVGRQVRKSDFRQIAIIPAEQTTPYSATTDYQTKFGSSYNANDVVYFIAYYIDKTTGQAGRPVQASAVIS